ncbi:MAG: cytochrome C [Nitrospirae bacterium]|nr:MAG: cytochrome C [Nitrospirota bacterium]
MKKILLLIVAMVLVASTAFAWTVVGSRHDLSSANVGGQVCVFCHTPHNANTSAGPLWSHSTSIATFTLYTSATLDNAIGQPSGMSKACMGCHDGTVGVGVISNGRTKGWFATTGHDGAASYASGGAILNTNAAYIGTDLRDDHPVSIEYSAVADTGLRAPTGDTVVNGLVTLQLYGAGPTYKVECASCHNVHNNTAVPFLRTSNSNSQICTTCHLK